MNLYPFQEQAVSQMIDFLQSNETHSVYNASEQGCVSGDATITVNRAKIARKMTLRELCYKFNGGTSGQHRSWDLSIPTYVRSFNGKHVQLNKVNAALFKGLQETVCIRLPKFSLCVTLDHEVLTSNGWKTAGTLTQDDYIAVDTLTRHQKKKEHHKSTKLRYLARQVGEYHPYARNNVLRGKPIKLVDTHRLIMEAHENGIDLEQFIRATFSKQLAAPFKYNDPKIYHVHHVNKNTKDNRLGNLQKLLKEKHQALHCDYIRLGHGLLSYQKIRSVTPSGLRDVYDLVMEDPYRNFVATNMVVHNCGKTIMAIETLNKLDAKSVLIVCPAIMRLVWLEELQKWRKTKEPEIARALMSSSDVKDAQGISTIIISYDLARTPSVLALLKAQKFECMVLDEAHHLKNTRAKRTKVCFRELWDMAKYHILLSGTPFTVSVVDGYSPFHRILPKEFPDFHDFVSRFSYARQTPWGMQYFGLKNAEALKKIIRSNFYIRYTKDEVLKELPPKIFQRITLPIEYAVDPKAKNQADELRIQAEMVRRFLEEGKNPVIPSCLAEHRRMQGEAKLEPICEFISNQLEAEIPTVVFAHHRAVIAAIAERFKSCNPAVITGETSASNRDTYIKRFQNADTNLFIGQFTAAGTGITLTRSSNCVLAELDWSPAVLAQAWDRLHRISQSRPVNIYWFTVASSIDETISNIVMNRAKLFKTVLD